jgi:hypothetical protein
MKASASAGRVTPAVTGSGGQLGEGIRVADRYRLVERLGTRGAAMMWKAVDEVLARPVTVFTLAPGSRCAQEVMAAARAAAQVSDPRLARIFDADDAAYPVHVVTEWPGGVQLAELVAAAPLEPWRAARIIAEAAQAVAAAHAGGLNHLCLAPDSLWCGVQGEVKITGLGIDAALSGTQASDPPQTDTRDLARLLYAALTGYWPGPEPTGLPPAPRSHGRLCRAGQVRPGVTGRLDRVLSRALDGAGGGDEPPITSAACLAAELAAITPPGPPPAGEPGHIQAGEPGGSVTATLPLSPAPLPLPFLDAPGQPPVPPVTRADPATPVKGAAGPGGQPSSGPRAAGRRRPPWRTLIVFLLALAVLAGGGLLIHRLTASHRPGTAAHGTHPPAAVVISPVRATAFGPTGEADGDNPQLARLAIDASAATSWHTDWYATAAFGGLQDGTGLLLDLGHPVAVTRARLVLGSTPGAGLQLRAGNVPALASLRPVARTADASGVVRLRLSKPAHARYLLIWFTRLPPHTSSTFQAGIYQVRLQGPPHQRLSSSTRQCARLASSCARRHRSSASGPGTFLATRPARSSTSTVSARR